MAIIEQGILSSGIIATSIWLASALGDYIQTIYQLPFFK